jgi:hypothetical protein
MSIIETEKAWGRNGVMALIAVQACIGQRAETVEKCADWLSEVWLSLPVEARARISYEVDDVLRRPDILDEYAHAQWERIAKQWRGIST